MAKAKVNKEGKGFFSKLLADGTSDTVSSKRLCMLLSMIVFVSLAFFSAFGHSCTPEFIYILGGLILGESGLSTAEKIKKVSSDYYSNNSSATTDASEEEIGDC